MSGQKRPKAEETADTIRALVGTCLENLRASDPSDVWASLKMLAEIRTTLGTTDRALIKANASGLLFSDDVRLKGQKWDEGVLCSIRALIYLILGDREQERRNLEQCLELGLRNKGKIASQFEKLGTSHHDLIEKCRPKRRLKSTRTPVAGELHKLNIMQYAPGMADPEQTKKGIEKTGGNLVRAKLPKGPGIELEREFFSQGPDIAEARLVYLVAAMAASYPDRKESLKFKVVKAIDGGKSSVADPPISKKPLKEVKLPPLTGHPLIEELASLWGQHEKLRRVELVRRFQGALDRTFIEKNLGSFDKNKTLVCWINFISKKLRIALIYNDSNHKDEEVRIRYSKTTKTGYFDLREAGGNGDLLPNTGSTTFHRLSTRSRTGRNSALS